MKQNFAKWIRSVTQSFAREIRWLTPGLGVKRWIGLILIGAFSIGIGLVVLVLGVYQSGPNSWLEAILYFISLEFISRPIRILIYIGFGVLIIGIGIAGLNRAILRPFIHPGKPVIETVSAYRKKERGPRIVTIGGGNGLASILRGLKNHTNNLTAIVTVADDGGSSGELRKAIGILPPGDIRNCLTALSNDERLLTQLFQYRFAAGAGLNGHNLGNLFITALTEITGSFEEALAESGRVLAISGKVLPSTLHDVRLVANIAMTDQVKTIVVRGESQIPKINGKIQRVWLEPSNPLGFPPAIQSILAADLIIVGPGSLYTSILPNLLVPDIASAIKASRALKFYICNVATQRGETDGFQCGDHIRVINQHIGGHIFDLMICNNNFQGSLSSGVDWVIPEDNLEEEQVIYKADLIDVENPWRHNSEKIARVIMDLFYERTGPLLFREDEYS